LLYTITHCHAHVKCKTGSKPTFLGSAYNFITKFNKIVHRPLPDTDKLYSDKPHLAAIRDRLANLNKLKQKKFKKLEVLWPVEVFADKEAVGAR